MSFVIAPSILAAHLARLGDEARAVLEAGADYLHVDVMDNHYVPNLTFGPVIVSALRNAGIRAPLDVHLMIEPVDRIIPDFAAAGASIISIHPETSRHLDRSLRLIRDSGCRAGLVLNPATPLSYLEDCVLEQLDLVLLMSVNPGFGGQALLPMIYNKLQQVRQRLDAFGREIRLEVDGGVDINNIGRLASCGADTFVAGSAIFGSDDYAATIAAMRAQLAAVPAAASTP